MTQKAVGEALSVNQLAVERGHEHPVTAGIGDEEPVTCLVGEHLAGKAQRGRQRRLDLKELTERRWIDEAVVAVLISHDADRWCQPFVYALA